MLVVAGHESTVNLLGNAVLSLLQYPDQLRLLHERPELTTGAVEEFARHDTAGERSTNRYAAEEIELGGARIPGQAWSSSHSARRAMTPRRPSATTRPSSTRRGAAIWSSGTASTTAWTPRWPDWRRRSPCGSCSRAYWSSNSPYP
jgi:hypothetical protein